MSSQTTIAVGATLPHHVFKIKKDDDNGPAEFDSEALYGASAGTVVIFGLPGAFTPTCSAKHLPGYVEDHAKLTEKGVSHVYCLSVNDAFVMRAWEKATASEGKVVLLPDPDASFTAKLGLTTDIPALGGIRSQRFALVAKNGVVTHVAVEEAGKFEVSSSESIINFV